MTSFSDGNREHQSQWTLWSTGATWPPGQCIHEAGPTHPFPARLSDTCRPISFFTASVSPTSFLSNGSDPGPQ